MADVALLRQGVIARSLVVGQGAVATQHANQCERVTAQTIKEGLLQHVIALVAAQAPAKRNTVV